LRDHFSDSSIFPPSEGSKTEEQVSDPSRGQQILLTSGFFVIVTEMKRA